MEMLIILFNNAMGLTHQTYRAWKNTYKKGALFQNHMLYPNSPYLYPTPEWLSIQITLIPSHYVNDGRIWVPKNMEDVCH